MDMDMDVAWCLTCSKQTRDPRSPYCSEACRLQDTDPTTNQNGPIPLTSPVPFGLIPSPTRPTHAGSSTSQTNQSPARRPSIGPLAPLPSSYRSKPVPRDRRAFSFPATQSVAPLPIKISNSRRPTQTGETLQFARRTNPIAVNMTASPSAGALSVPRVKGFDKLSKTTGANTPVFQDSVFCSTSESSDNEGIDIKDVSPMKIPKPLTPLETTVRPPNIKRASVSKAFVVTSPRNDAFASIAEPSTRPPFISRKSPSPVAAMIASSASSKSREDIVSWLNEVKRLPTKDEDEHEHPHLDQSHHPRGRSRTRREVLANLPPPSQESIDEQYEGENGIFGTTPKGRIGSALAGLSSFGAFGVGPIVKALTGVTSSATTASQPTSTVTASTAPATTGLGLQSVPAPAEVSRIAVTVATPAEPELSQFLQMGGTTPTLSTVSISEVIDPLTDNGEHIDFMTSTDDQSAAGSSSFMRRRFSSVGQGKAPSSLLSVGGKQAPAKPVTSTASAIWNLPAYIRSFAHLSISSVLPPYAPIAAADAQAQAQAQTNLPSPLPTTKSQAPDQPGPAPVPAARPVTPDEVEESPAQQMVRSLPMDIVMPVGGENTHVDRARQREEVREWLGTPTSSRSASRSQVRDRDRTQSRNKPRYRSRSACNSRSASHSRHGRKISYDADASAEEEGGESHGINMERRGRSRREKGLRGSSPGPAEEKSRRGSDVRMEDVEEERERGRGRGRDRTVRV
ncbi:hypothetical protein I302_103740 [Kwoniella bestiolae CBS 10118]|uniref:Uncharacterized protein n=1 Tax=Kwoniella bestiolae CBS 10118 TaxID=1296100 RepID=A0A1B9G9E6_9TREE|nr:hypothetical protein I302_02443 [Kwoniella bestiolae CBS 10118]OCF27600.1 hypothetical protein I302_02443 [Kwoniella bestiolae CBS 10118]